MGDSPRCLWVLVCHDDPRLGYVDGSPRGGSVKRIANYDAHKAYQGRDPPPGVTKLSAGPILSDDGKTMLGSCFLLEGTKEAVEGFYKNDPFYTMDVWETITLRRYFAVGEGVQAYKPRL